jgi:hypothetical protein
MSQVTLKFPTLKQLADFQKQVNKEAYIIEISSKTFTSMFTTTEVETAKNTYNAVVLVLIN